MSGIIQLDLTKDGKPVTAFIDSSACVDGKKESHNWDGWREFEDGLGAESYCTKCGMGAMQFSLWNDP